MKSMPKPQDRPCHWRPILKSPESIPILQHQEGIPLVNKAQISMLPLTLPWKEMAMPRQVSALDMMPTSGLRIQLLVPSPILMWSAFSCRSPQCLKIPLTSPTTDLAHIPTDPRSPLTSCTDRHNFILGRRSCLQKDHLLMPRNLRRANVPE